MADTSNGLIFGLAQVMFAPDQGEEDWDGFLKKDFRQAARLQVSPTSTPHR